MTGAETCREFVTPKPLLSFTHSKQPDHEVSNSSGRK
jgi:hypothetical protein